jgi:hypothetical protein
MLRNLGYGFLLASVQAPKLAATGRKSQNVQCTQFACTFFSNQIAGSRSRHNACKRSPIVLSHCVDQAMGSERHPHSDEDYCIFDPRSSYDGVGEDVCHVGHNVASLLRTLLS